MKTSKNVSTLQLTTFWKAVKNHYLVYQIADIQLFDKQAEDQNLQLKTNF